MLLPVTAHAARNLTGASMDRPVLIITGEGWIGGDGGGEWIFEFAGDLLQRMEAARSFCWPGRLGPWR